MSLFASTPFRILLLLTFFVALIGGFAWYAATLKYEKDTAHLQFVDPSNPLWAEAKNEAAATIDSFVALYPQYPDNSFVKFSHNGVSGFKEDIWAKVTSMGPGYVSVTIETKYLKDKDAINTKELPLGQLVDWMVELPSGQIRGGFTTQALLLIKMQQQDTNADSSLALFIDKINP